MVRRTSEARRTYRSVQNHLIENAPRTGCTGEDKEKGIMYTVRSSPASWRRPQCSLPALIGVIVLFLLVGSLNATAADTDVLPEALGSISGVVTAAAGQPISGVEVTVYRSGEFALWNQVRTVTTDDGGAYTVPALRTGIYRLRLRDPQGNHAREYYDKSPTLEGGNDLLVAGNDVTGVDVRLAPPAAISGVVTIQDGVTPDRGLVLLYGQAGVGWKVVDLTSVVTPTGSYSFGELPAGSYRVCASGTLGDGYNPDWFAGCYGGVRLEVARSIQVTTGATLSQIDFQLAEGQFEGKITGRVTSDGVPIGGIQVSLYLPYLPDFPNPYLPLVYTYTNAAGEYQLGGLEDGRYQVGFSHPAGDYMSRYYPNVDWADSAQVIVVRGGATVSNINVDLPRAGGISGRVRFVDTAPLASTWVSFYQFTGEHWVSWGRRVVIEPDGAYIIKPILPGTYRVCMSFDLPAGPSEPYPTFHFPNCFGTDRLSGAGAESATDITIVAGVTTGGIDFAIGPDRWCAPMVRTQ